MSMRSITDVSRTGGSPSCVVLDKDGVCQLSVNGTITIMIHFHHTHYRDVKAYYLPCMAVQLRAEFPQRFGELLPTIVLS